MPNPIMDFLRGPRANVQPKQEQPVEQKLWMLPDTGAAIRAGMLVHGPFATRMIDAAYGLGGDGNSAVFACLSAICTAFPEAPLRVFKADAATGERSWQVDHALQALLDKPNPYMSGPVLWHWTQYAKHIDGNAYWHKVRSGHPTEGNVIELWPISPTLIRPWRDKDSRNFIDSYKYQPKPGESNAVYIPPENIVHFKLGLDDRDHRLGCAPLKRLATEVMGDDLAAEWQASMLANGGAAGMVVQVPAGSEIDRATAETIKSDMSSRFAMGSQGKTAILTGGATMSQYGFSPEQMDMRSLHRLPEERIAAVLRVPAIIAGLGAGLDRATYANFREAREMFTEMTVLPLYTFDESVVNSSLLPDFTNDRRMYTAFDTTDLRALQEDADSLWKRVIEAWNGGLLTRNEALTEMGQKVIDGPEGDERKSAGPMAFADQNEQPALPPGNKSISLKAGEIDAETLQALVELSVPGFTGEFDKYLESTRRRVNRALTSS